MRVTTPKETIERIQVLLDEYWDSIDAESKPDTDRKWESRLGQKDALLSVQKMISRIYSENNYFVNVDGDTNEN